MRTYLSIDIDYWHSFGPKTLDQLKRVMQKGKDRGIPIIAVMNHQQMLREVNESNADKLINIDEHSDLTESAVKELTCGSWVSYVRWRRSAEYLWVRNRSDYNGSCNWNLRGFRRCSKRGWCIGSDWGIVNTENPGRGLDLMKYTQWCVGIGLCLSPDWCSEQGEEVFYDLVNEFGIPYRKGRRNEDSLIRRARPPFRKVA
jgi:hypothetical protein